VEVSESLISQIERNKVLPSLDTLISLLDALDVEPEYIFEGIRRKKKPVVLHQGQRKEISQQGVSYQQIGILQEHDAIEGAELTYLTIEPNAEKGSYDYGHGGKEIGIIIEGEGTLFYGNESIPLVTGDSMSFDSSIPHRIVCSGPKPLKAVWIISPARTYFQNMEES